MSSNINPLLLDIILEKVLGNLQLKDLKNCILICKEWSDVTYPILACKSKDTIVFGQSNRSKPIDKFIKALKFGLRIPYTSFTLEPSIMSLQRSQTIQDLFSWAGIYMTSLSITYQDHSHFLTGDSNISLSTLLPSLGHLRFGLIPSDQFFGRHGKTLGGDFLFKEIFQAAKNLFKLELAIPKDQRNLVDPFITTITSSSTKSHSCLKQLVLNCGLSSGNIYKLQHTDFPLEMIRVKFKDSFSYKSLVHFITSKESTLKILRIDCWPTPLKFPSLVNLHTLEILESGYFHNYGTKRFKFSYNLPNLKRLLFQCHNWSINFIIFFSEGQSAKNVCELKLPKTIGVDCYFLVRRISNVFPLLAKLEIFLDSDNIHCLTDVFGELSNLEDLSISFINWRGTRCVDSVITGISERICKEIYALCDVSSINLDGFRRRHCILDLKRLKRLQLRNMTISERGRPQYSEISGYQLLQHTALTTLSIWPSQISEECIQRLGMKFQLQLHSF